MSELASWLAGLGLEHLAPVFESREVDMQSLPLLTDTDLEQMGIELGPRRRILHAAGRLPIPDSTLAPHDVPIEGLDSGERRHLTVMFADIVGWTALSLRFDPEECRQILKAYHGYCRESIHQHGGWVAQYLGDGVMAYYGYPKAHEDDVQRAIRTGLAIVRGVDDLNRQLPEKAAGWITLRVGIDTGQSVIDSFSLDSRRDRLAHSDVPNIASRIQGIAEPNSVVVSDRTYRLATGSFQWTGLGVQSLKGLELAPLEAWRVDGEVAGHSRFDARASEGLTPYTGREHEVQTLHAAWTQARAGHGQIVALRGDAGMGKSRLGRLLFDRVKDEGIESLKLQCIEHFSNTPWYPFVEASRRVLRIEAEVSAADSLAKVHATMTVHYGRSERDVQLMCSLLSIPFEARLGPLRISADRQKHDIARLLVDLLIQSAARAPMLILVEDLHWADPSTVELLQRIANNVEGNRILLVLTYRPEVEFTWVGMPDIVRIDLQALDETDCHRLIGHMVGSKSLPAELSRFIVQRSDRIPLYLEALTRRLLQPDVCRDLGDRYELLAPLELIPIPESLQDFLMSRLDGDRLTRGIAQVGSAIGRDFTLDLLSRVSQLRPATLENGVGALVRDGLLKVRAASEGGKYTFGHALVRDAAYATLTTQSRELLHGRIAQALESGDGGSGPINPEVIARHYTRARQYAAAAKYWHKAGLHAAARSANVEALELFNQGLDLVAKIDARDEANELELALLTAVGPILVATKGYAAQEVEQVYAKARELSHYARDNTHLFAVIRGQYQYLLLRAKYGEAFAVATQLRAIAHDTNDAVLIADACTCVGLCDLYQGRFESACATLSQAILPYNTDDHFNHAMQSSVHIGIVTPTYLARALWFTGDHARAVELCEASLGKAGKAGLVLSQAQVLGMVAILNHMLGDVERTEAVSAELLSLAREQRLPYWEALANALGGWVLLEKGQLDAAQPFISESLGRYVRTGALLGNSWLMLLEADAFLRVGQVDAARRSISAADLHARSTDENYYLAEIARMRGVAALTAGQGDESGAAETHFLEAMSIARSQGARTLELRAAVSMGKLLMAEHRGTEAGALLRSVMEGFPGPCISADVRAARDTLDLIAPGRSVVPACPVAP